MHSDEPSIIEEEFWSALALLHSNEENSVEKLRMMLDSSLEKKLGYQKTLTARMPKDFFAKEQTRWKSAMTSSALKDSCTDEREEEKKSKEPLEQQRENKSEICKNFVGKSTKSLKIIEIEIEEDFEKSDVPRISIPDEGSAEGALCKICNGAKLGPLILLECQECQEIYHPLCHQPPVLDIDVYDPRLVWRCEKCTRSTLPRADSKIQGRKAQNRAAVRTAASREGRNASREYERKKLCVHSRKNVAKSSDQQNDVNETIDDNATVKTQLPSKTQPQHSSNSAQRSKGACLTAQPKKKAACKVPVVCASVK